MDPTCLLVLLPLSLGALAPGGSDPQPAGRLSTVSALRAGTGGLAEELGFGCAIGLEAGYQPMGPDQRVGWGVSWSTMLSWYGDGSTRVADQLALVEMDAGVRLRVALGERRRLVLFGGGGGALLRVNEPLTRDGERDYVAPWGAAGIEFVVMGRLVGVEMRYGNMIDGSGIMGLQLNLGRGI